jgi:hypothetical protein
MKISMGLAREGQAGETWQLLKKNLFRLPDEHLTEHRCHTILFSSVCETNTLHTAHRTLHTALYAVHSTVKCRLVQRS